MVGLWGVNVFVFLRSRVNYAKVFDLDHNHLTHREIWNVSRRTAQIGQLISMLRIILAINLATLIVSK
jgi:hypothetical protein